MEVCAWWSVQEIRCVKIVGFFSLYVCHPLALVAVSFRYKKEGGDNLGHLVSDYIHLIDTPWTPTTQPSKKGEAHRNILHSEEINALNRLVETTLLCHDQSRKTSLLTCIELFIGIECQNLNKKHINKVIHYVSKLDHSSKQLPTG